LRSRDCDAGGPARFRIERLAEPCQEDAMKKLIAAMFLSVAVFALNSSLAPQRLAAAEPPAGDQSGSCVWECGSTGTFYQKPTLCAAACAEPCEPLCW
jgi:hypothetical protein